MPKKNKQQELMETVFKLRKQAIGQIKVVGISAKRYSGGKFKIHVYIDGIPKDIDGYEVCLEHGGSVHG